jgi:hypothetical protein
MVESGRRLAIELPAEIIKRVNVELLHECCIRCMLHQIEPLCKPEPSPS